MDTAPKILKWRQKLVQEETHSSAHWVLDYVSGEGDFIVAMMDAHWSAKGIESDEQKREKAKRRYGVSVIYPNETSKLDELSFGAVTAWNGLPDEGYLPPLEALTVFHKVLVENGSLFLALPSSEYSKENVAMMANEAGFGIDAIFPQPETGLFSFIQNMSTKKRTESASVIVYHLKKLDTLNFHVF